MFKAVLSFLGVSPFKALEKYIHRKMSFSSILQVDVLQVKSTHDFNILSPNSDENKISLYLFKHSNDENKGSVYQG